MVAEGEEIRCATCDRIIPKYKFGMPRWVGHSFQLASEKHICGDCADEIYEHCRESP